MENAKRDRNNVSTLLGTLNTTGTDLVRIKADATDHGLKVSFGTTGTDHGPQNALRDENSVTGLMCVSSADGVTPVSVYADSSGNLLVQLI